MVLPPGTVPLPSADLHILLNDQIGPADPCTFIHFFLLLELTLLLSFYTHLFPNRLLESQRRILPFALNRGKRGAVVLLWQCPRDAQGLLRFGDICKIIYGLMEDDGVPERVGKDKSAVLFMILLSTFEILVQLKNTLSFTNTLNFIPFALDDGKSHEYA